MLSVRWSEVNFETNRVTVSSCETEHLEGKAYRVVPIFASLRPFPEEAFELAPEGAEYVVPGDPRLTALKPGGWINTNLRTQFMKIIGNTPKIALGHYLQTLDTDFEKAIKGGAESGAEVVQNAVQSGTAGEGPETQSLRNHLKTTAIGPPGRVPTVIVQTISWPRWESKRLMQV